jgi:hypothetical protein
MAGDLNLWTERSGLVFPASLSGASDWEWTRGVGLFRNIHSNRRNSGKATLEKSGAATT